MAATETRETPFLAGRFRAVRLLKRSQGVDTWLASDEEEGDRPVVVKTVAAAGVSPSTRARLEHEAQVLRRLETQSFRPLVAWGRHGDALFLVQPFVDGVTLHERLGSGPLSPGSALKMGIDVLSHLGVAHDEGVLHRDVKPANIMIDGDEPVRRAVLIDFGLAKSAGLDPSVRDEPVGTARYLAPEASGLLDIVADERADLYSFGVVLFECLAGRPPFEGKSVGEVLRQHLTSPAPRLRSLGVAVPRVLDEVVARLLRKDPDERYQSAAAALADLEQIAAALEQGVPDPRVTIGLHDRRIALTEAGFVGRATELATLTGLLAKAGRGRGGLVLVEAESGGGKSRLLDEGQEPPARRSDRRRGAGGVDPAGPRCRPGRPAPVPTARRRRRHHPGRSRDRPGLHHPSAGPSGRSNRGGGRRPARPGRRPRPRRPRASRSRGLRRGAKHRGPQRPLRLAGRTRPPRSGPARRLPVGRRPDRPPPRPVERAIGARPLPRAGAGRRRLPFRRSRARARPPGPAAHGRHHPRALRPDRRGPAVHLDGRDPAGGGPRDRRPPGRGQPVHGLGRPARHGRVRRPALGRTGGRGMADRPRGHGGGANLEAGGAVPRTAAGAPVTRGPRAAGRGRGAGQGVRPGPGLGTVRPHAGRGDGPAPGGPSPPDPLGRRSLEAMQLLPRQAPRSPSHPALVR